MKERRSYPDRSTKRRLLEVRSLEDWREWLAAHHDTDLEVWLVFYKRVSGRPSIAYQDALDEALCVGWIDSLVKRLDDVRYARKFTPRKEESKWSDANRKHYARLKAQHRLTPAGAQRAPTKNRSVAPAKLVTTIPTYIRNALKQQPEAWTYFSHLPPSHKRMYVGWIDSAKRPETRERRLAAAIGMLAAGKRLGLK
jgi:uncharacterized protein YdeI (YjbR/CyaY-like superfamily)